MQREAQLLPIPWRTSTLLAREKHMIRKVWLGMFLLLMVFSVAVLSQRSSPHKALLLANTIYSPDATALQEFYGWYDSRDPYKHTRAVKLVNEMVEGKNTYPLFWNRNHRWVYVFDEFAGYVRFMDTTTYAREGDRNSCSSYTKKTAFMNLR
jgi:hypothetical protein